MAIIYVDPAHGGTDSGTETNPYTDLMSAIGDVADGDTIKMQGTQTLTSGGTATISFSGLVGTPANGGIQIIGTNSSWVDDGTLAVLDGNDANGDDGISWDGGDGIRLKNFRCKCMSGDGLAVDYVGSYSLYNFLDNIVCDNNGANGAVLSSLRYSIVKHLYAGHNAGGGIYRPSAATYLIFPVSDNNSTYGIDVTGVIFIYHPIVRGNGGDGIRTTGGPIIIGGTVDDNGSDGLAQTYALNANLVMLLASRITNNGAFGLLNASTLMWMFEDYNYINNNTSGAISGYTLGGDETETSGTDGYSNQSTGDYNLTSSATNKSIEVVLQDYHSAE